MSSPFLDKKIRSIPIVNKKKLDLYKLFTVVVQKGGAALVTDRRLWAAIVSELGVQDINRSSSRLRDQ